MKDNISSYVCLVIPRSVVVLLLCFPDRLPGLSFFGNPFSCLPECLILHFSLSLYTQDSTVTSSLLPPLSGSHPILNPEQASLLDYKVPS